MANDAADWLFMLYLSGDNNLSSEMIWSLKEIEEQKLPEGVEITILYDALSPYVPTYVFDLSGKSKKGPAGSQKTETSHIIPLPLLPGAGATKSKIYEWVEDSSDKNTLRKFIEWSVRERPSKSRMLVLSGHGSGAVGDFLPDNHANDGNNGSLTIPGLQEAFHSALTNLRSTEHVGAETKLIDVLGMDSCLMSMAEVCYEVRDSVEYLVGSEGFVQNAGWPYGYMLSRLRNRPKEKQKTNAKFMAQRIVEDYIAYYREYLPADVSVDIAACELAKLSQPSERKDSKTLRRAISKLASLLTDQLELCKPDTAPNSAEALVRDAIILAHWRAQSYKFEQYTDLWDFCEQLLKSATYHRWDGIRDSCEDVQQAINLSVGRRQNYEGIDFQHSHGLSVYFPWSGAAFSEGDKNAYKKLAFARDTAWGDFLELYVDKTRREPRGSKGRSKTLFGGDSEEAQEKADERDSMPQFAPPSVRNAPYSGRNAPYSGRNAPYSGRNAPYSGRMLQLLLESQNASMKNPPLSVYPLSARQFAKKAKKKAKKNAAK